MPLALRGREGAGWGAWVLHEGLWCSPVSSHQLLCRGMGVWEGAGSCLD